MAVFLGVFRKMLEEYLKFGCVCMPNAFVHPQPLRKRVPHRVESSASSFIFQYPVFSLGLFSRLLRLLPRLPVTSILPSILPSVMCCRRQFLRKMLPNHSTFLLFMVTRIFLLSLTRCSTYFLTPRAQIIFSILLQHCISKFFSYY